MGATQDLSQPVSEVSQAPSRSAEADFELLFITHYERILTVLFRLVGDRQRAEELANEVFWKLYRQPLWVRPKTNVGGWLYKTATRLGLDALRSSARRMRHEQAACVIEQAGTGPLDELLRAEQCRRVRQVLSSMKAAQAEILLLRASGSSYQEMGAALGVSVSGVGTLLNRAEAEFRKRYLKLAGTGKEKL